MRLRSYHTALFGIVFFFVAWDLWAVLSDLRITISPDSSSPGTIQLRHLIFENWCANQLQHWLYTHKGPALHLLALPLLLLIEQAPLSSRILGVLLHGVVLWQVFCLCRGLGGDRRAALLSTILLGASPMVFGWFRLDFYEGLHSVIACAVLQMMIKVRLDRPGPAAALGLLIGLGVLTKNSFYLIMVAPALWFLWCRCRHLRSWPSLLALVATTALLVVPWVVFKFSELVDNFFGSTGSNAFTWDKFLESSSLYLSLPGVALLLLCACLSAVALWRRGGTAGSGVGVGDVGRLCDLHLCHGGCLVPLYPAHLSPGRGPQRLRPLAGSTADPNRPAAACGHGVYRPAGGRVHHPEHGLTAATARA